MWSEQHNKAFNFDMLRVHDFVLERLGDDALTSSFLSEVFPKHAGDVRLLKNPRL